MERTIKNIDDQYFTQDDETGFSIAKPNGIITLGIKEEDDKKNPGNKIQVFKPFNMDYELYYKRVKFSRDTFNHQGGISYGDGWLGGPANRHEIISDPINISKFFKGHLVVEWKEEEEGGQNPPTLVKVDGTILSESNDSIVDLYICNIDENQENPKNHIETNPDDQYDAEYWRFFKTLKFQKHNRRVYNQDKIKNPLYTPKYNSEFLSINNYRGNIDNKFYKPVALSTTDTHYIIATISVDQTNKNVIQVHRHNFDTFIAWQQLGTNIIVNGEPNDLTKFPFSMNKKGNIVALQNGPERFTVYRFIKNSNSWEQLGKNIEESVGNKNDISIDISLNSSVNIDGHIAATIWKDIINNNIILRVYKYNHLNTIEDWEIMGNPIDTGFISDGNEVVSINSQGNTVVIGFSNPSIAKIYKYDGNTWVNFGNTINGDNNSGFGRRVSINSDGKTIVISGLPTGGAILGAEGYVKVYKFNDIQEDWDLNETFTTKNTDNDNPDYYGNSISINSEGNILAIGAPSLNGAGAGYVDIYTYHDDKNEWNLIETGKIQSNINPVGEGNRFGISVSVNTFGGKNTVAVASIDPGLAIVAGSEENIQLFELKQTNKNEEFLRGECYVCSEEINFPSKYFILKAIKSQGTLCRIQSHLYSKK